MPSFIGLIATKLFEKKIVSVFFPPIFQDPVKMRELQLAPRGPSSSPARTVKKGMNELSGTTNRLIGPGTETIDPYNQATKMKDLPGIKMKNPGADLPEQTGTGMHLNETGKKDRKPFIVATETVTEVETGHPVTKVATVNEDHSDRKP